MAGSTADAADPFPDPLPPAALIARIHLLGRVGRGCTEALDGSKGDVPVYEATLEGGGPGVEFLLLRMRMRGGARVRRVPRGEIGVLGRCGAHGHGPPGRGGAASWRRRRGREEEVALWVERVSGCVSAGMVPHLAQHPLQPRAQDLLMRRQLVLQLPCGDGRRMPAAVLAGRRRGCAVGQHVAEEAFGFGRRG